MGYRPMPWRHPAFLVTVRIAVGLLFLVTGILKAKAPPEEFAAVIRTYQILPEKTLVPLAMVLPWIEMVSGTLMAVGLWSRWSTRIVGLMLLAFTLALGSAWVRGIDLSDCGCFGSLGLRETGPQAFTRNVVLLTCMIPIIKVRKMPWSLDRLFQLGEYSSD